MGAKSGQYEYGGLPLTRRMRDALHDVQRKRAQPSQDHAHPVALCSRAFHAENPVRKLTAHSSPGLIR